MARVALRRGRPDEMRARFADAARRQESEESWTELARTLGMRAEALASIGDVDAAAADRARAEELTTRYGLSPAWAWIDR